MGKRLDPRWKALTAPLWADLELNRSCLEGTTYPDEAYRPLLEGAIRLQRVRILNQLVAIRRARLSGQDPVIYKLSRPGKGEQ